jgi:hypothetical protein
MARAGREWPVQRFGVVDSDSGNDRWVVPAIFIFQKRIMYFAAGAVKE